MATGLAVYGLSLVAGALSTLSPCVLPILPIVLGAALAAHRWGALALAAGLAISFSAVGLFVATIGYGLGMDGEWFRTVAAVLLIVFGLVLLSARLQAQFAAAVSWLTGAADGALSSLRLEGFGGQLCVGALLGVVWIPCVGPTLGAAAVLAAQGRDLAQVASVMIMFGIGAAAPLVVLGAVSGAVMARSRVRFLAAGRIGKTVLGVLLVGFGLLIVSGIDKRVEAFLVTHSPAWLTELTTRY